MCDQDNTSTDSESGRLRKVLDDHFRLCARLEQAMVGAHGVPVTVMYSFRRFELVCERHDGQPLSVDQERTWAFLLGSSENVQLAVASGDRSHLIRKGANKNV